MSLQTKDIKKTQRLIIVVMFLFAFFNSAYVQLNTPLLSTMIQTQGWTNETLCNLIVTIGNLAQIPAYILGGILGSKMNKKKLAYISIACFLIGGLLIIPLSFNIYLVLLCRFVVGCGSGMLILISTAILPDFFEGKQLSNAIGLVLAGSGFWGFIFANIAGVIGQAYGWKVAYFLHLYALIPLLLFALFIPQRPLIQKTTQSKTTSQKTSALNPMVLIYTLFGMISFMFIQGVWSNSSIWVTQTLGGTVTQAGLASSIISLFSFLGRVAFGQIYSRLHKYTLHLNIIILTIGMYLCSIASSFTTALIAIAFIGTAMGLVAPIALNRCIEIAPENQEAAQAISSIGFAIGNFSSTYWKLFLNQISSGSLSSAFGMNTYFCIAFLIVAILFLFFTRSKKETNISK